MIARVLRSVLVGVVTFIIAAVVLSLIKALIPGLDMDVKTFAGVIALLAGLAYFFTGARELV